jgi:tetratricopeptide (TPR) repeat protein
VAACALAMASKETAVVAPLLVVAWDHVFRPGGARRWRLYAALAATWLIVLLPMLGETQGRTALTRALKDSTWTPLTHLWTQAGVIAHYLALAFLPRPLVFDYYGWPRATSPGDVLPSLLLVGALLALSLWALIRRSPVGFAGAAFFLTLAPTSSVLPIPTEIAAEHRMYLPLAALLGLAACVVIKSIASKADAALRSRQTPRNRIAVTVLLAVIVVQSIAMTRQRNGDYASEMALWQDTVRKRPDNARARINYGIGLMTAGRAADAEAQMRTALTLDMDGETRARVYLQLGSALAAQGQLDEGIANVERALRLDPSVEDADTILGQAYADKGNDALAVKHLLRAVERKDLPRRELLLQRTAWLLATSRDPSVRDGARAATLAEAAIGLTSPQQAVMFETLAAARAEQGRPADAVAAIDRALSLSRASGDAQTTSLYERQRAFYAAGGRVAK